MCEFNIINDCPYEYNFNNEFCRKITEFMNGGLFINENNYNNLTIITGINGYIGLIDEETC